MHVDMLTGDLLPKRKNLTLLILGLSLGIDRQTPADAQSASRIEFEQDFSRPLQQLIFLGGARDVRQNVATELGLVVLLGSFEDLLGEKIVRIVVNRGEDLVENPCEGRAGLFDRQYRVTKVKKTTPFEWEVLAQRVSVTSRRGFRDLRTGGGFVGGFGEIGLKSRRNLPQTLREVTETPRKPPTASMARVGGFDATRQNRPLKRGSFFDFCNPVAVSYAAKTARLISFLSLRS